MAATTEVHGVMVTIYAVGAAFGGSVEAEVDACKKRGLSADDLRQIARELFVCAERMDASNARARELAADLAKGREAGFDG